MTINQSSKKPLGNNILTKQVGNKKTNYGLITSSLNKDTRPEVAKVVSIGDNVKDVKIGDNLFFSKYAGIRINVDKEEYLLLSRNEVFGFNNNNLDIKMGETKDLMGIMESIGKIVEGD